MQRLERERHVRVPRILEQFGRSVLDLRMGRARDPCSARCRAGRYCGRPPTTSTRHGEPSAFASSTARRLSSRASLPVRLVGGKHAAAAIAGELEPGVAHRFHRTVEPDLGDLIAPGRHRADVVPRAGLDDADEIGLLANGRGVDGQPAMIAGEIAHVSPRRRAPPARRACARPQARDRAASRPHRRAGKCRRDAASSARFPARRPW